MKITEPKNQLTHYKEFFDQIKSRIHQGQTRAVLVTNAELVRLYWDIGRTIVDRQKSEGWGTKVIDRLASDLKAAFPTMKGFSSSNLKYMRYFAENCPDLRIGQQAADQLPWFHIVTLLTQLDSAETQSWLVRALPEPLDTSLPTIEAIEAEFGELTNEEKK